MQFTTIEQLVASAETKKVKISDIMIEQEMETSGQDKDTLYENMFKHLKVMEQAVERGLKEDLKSRSGLVGGDARLLSQYNQSNRSLAGNLIIQAMSMAMATAEVNACMGAVVATPTAGSCGVVPGCIFAAGSHLKASRKDLVDALFAAGAVGLVIANNASIAGAAGGCQAEIGSASAMAAAAVVQLAGGTPRQCANAVAIVLKSVLGLVCDPVAGLVEIPCIKRNATGASLAIVSADMALAGIESAIPCDEVIDAMYRVGRSIPVTLRETSMGGLATTETAKKIEKKVL
ncbi:L-serine dehydratase [Desulfohalotomaculum tongense]|uniref:L-serine ammonia-lyase, iron-sulfur-dependent, subunit alpha n=1 Tax=Desulforadius tongensis TaxID=1216062 RepID=UPI00195742A0|nr:L-serine ammonia-lyase, iron-sulfur-dependent, subunit alpha [Desulforadius tongensis]MBM7855388.1 L-serine dehydratase [Desulforadius tongensis]